jgi:hypothetical protein
VRRRAAPGVPVRATNHQRPKALRVLGNLFAAAPGEPFVSSVVAGAAPVDPAVAPVLFWVGPWAVLELPEQAGTASATATAKSRGNDVRARRRGTKRELDAGISDPKLGEGHPG